MRAHPWVDGPISDEEFLMIVGAYRSGTTSLFSYLANHPEVRPASYKEPGFFFSLEWAKQPPRYPPGREVDAYLSSFRRRPGGHLLTEATPNYLFDPGCAARIRAALPRAKIVVILREPIERLVSWYRHSVFQGRITADVDLATWVEGRLDDTRPMPELNFMEQALRHGQYSNYLPEYFEAFGRQSVHVIWFDDLDGRPLETLHRLCRFAGIDSGFFDSYQFTRENAAMQFARGRLYAAYIRGCQVLVRALRGAPTLQYHMNRAIFAPEPRLLRMATKPADAVRVPSELRARLVDYYRPDVEPLRRLVGEDVPWAAEYGQ